MFQRLTFLFVDLQIGSFFLGILQFLFLLLNRVNFSWHLSWPIEYAPGGLQTFSESENGILFFVHDDTLFFIRGRFFINSEKFEGWAFESLGLVFELALGDTLVFQFKEVEVVGGVDGEIDFIVQKRWVFEFYYFLTRYFVLAILQLN